MEDCLINYMKKTNEISKNIDIKIKNLNDITDKDNLELEETLSSFEKIYELLNSAELKTKICINKLQKIPELLALKIKKSEIEKEKKLTGSVARAERFSKLEQINNEITNKQFDIIDDITIKYKTKIEGHENSIKILKELISNELELSVRDEKPILDYDSFKKKIEEHEKEIESSKIMIDDVSYDGRKRKKSLKRKSLKSKSLKRKSLKSKSLKRKSLKSKNLRYV